MPRPPRTGTPSTRRRTLRLSDDEHTELAEATTDLGIDWSTFMRQALAEALSDWRERRVFERRQQVVPVDQERRSGTDRRERSV